MNHDKVKELFQEVGDGTTDIGIRFVRQDWDDVKEIESLNTEDVEREFFSLIWSVHVFQQFSVSDVTRLRLLELELEEREILTEKFVNEVNAFIEDGLLEMEEHISRGTDPITGEKIKEEDGLHE